ncbi:MAG: 50S ribosomal protein L11 methyltransferase [Thermoanaerobaculia bacterium]
MKDFILEVSFDSTDAALEDLLQSRLYLTRSTGSSSIEINGTTTISAYFESPAERDDAVRELNDVEGIALHATERERVDWLDRYQQSLEPLFIGETFVVAPDAVLIPGDTTRHALIVPQEQAFGTGSHETTSLCIEILETLDVAGKRGLDIGAGSGILALAMCRLGAEQVIAFDNDVDAFAALRDNRDRNGVDDSSMPVFIGSIEALRGGVFDIVTMNIIPEVIIPLLGDVKRHAGGSLILSGILVVKRDDVVDACAAHGLVLSEERSKGEWWAGRFHLRTSASSAD